MKSTIRAALVAALLVVASGYMLIAVPLGWLLVSMARGQRLTPKQA